MLGLGNPILDEIDQKHAELSPPAQQAIALSGVPANARGLMGAPDAALPSDSPTGPVASAPAEAAAPLASPSRVRGLGGEQNPDASAHKAELNRLVASPSGIGQIHNPWARHGLQALDALGGAFFPGFEQRIPGTQGHHDVLVHQAQGNVNEDEKLSTDEANREHIGAETGELGARSAEEQARADAIRNPPLNDQQNVHVLPDGSVVAVHHDPKTGKSSAEVLYKGDPTTPSEIVDQMVNGKQHNVLVNKKTGETIRDLGEKGVTAPKETPEEQAITEYRKNNPGATIQEAREKTKIVAPERPPHALMIDPTTHRAIEVGPGSVVPEGAMTAAGVNSTSVPTSQTRAMAEVAPKVVGFVDRISQLIDQQEKNLGPGSSRFREFMAGKVGAGDPEYTKLRTDVGLLQTALMRMHVGARGGEQMMEHFRDLINSAKQDPANMRAALGEIRAYAQEVGHLGGGQSGQGSGAKPIIIEVGGKRLQYKGSGATDDLKNYTEVQR